MGWHFSFSAQDVSSAGEETLFKKKTFLGKDTGSKAILPFLLE